MARPKPSSSFPPKFLAVPLISIASLISLRGGSASGIDFAALSRRFREVGPDHRAYDFNRAPSEVWEAALGSNRIN
jgi:hypothetical protein